MTKNQKMEMWGCIMLFFATIFSALLFNQFVDPRLDAITPSIFPLWVLGLFLSLTILSGVICMRIYFGKQTLRSIKRRAGVVLTKYQ
jgi:hypothetical protein